MTAEIPEGLRRLVADAKAAAINQKGLSEALILYLAILGMTLERAGQSNSDHVPLSILRLAEEMIDEGLKEDPRNPDLRRDVEILHQFVVGGFEYQRKLRPPDPEQ